MDMVFRVYQGESADTVSLTPSFSSLFEQADDRSIVPAITAVSRRAPAFLNDLILFPPCCICVFLIFLCA